jgi:hypothetical protein
VIGRTAPTTEREVCARRLWEPGDLEAIDAVAVEATPDIALDADVRAAPKGPLQ